MEINATCDEKLGHKVPIWDESAGFGTKNVISELSSQ